MPLHLRPHSLRPSLPHVLVGTVWCISTLTGLLLGTAPAAAQAPVYRCGSSYSDAPCQGGHAIENPLSTVHDSTTAAPGQSTVYLCQGQGGGQFWSARHCQQHHATIERMETVPSSLPWAQQVQQAQHQWEQARSLTAPATRISPSRAQTSRSAQATRTARMPSEGRHATTCLPRDERSHASRQEKPRNTRSKAKRPDC